MTSPKIDQCACKIHTQQTYYLAALREVDVQGRDACNCRWCSVENGGSEGKKMWSNRGSFSEAIACPKVDLRPGDPDATGGFMGRKLECGFSDCEVCGFGREGGIPTCKALEESQQLVEWTRYEDLEREGKKPLPNQLVTKECKLCDLWTDFKQHSKVYMDHHTKACGGGTATGRTCTRSQTATWLSK